ncbi:MAG: hypothetical protein HY695_05880 [Deltaproteobacteria bacterium]|nr:hypothetical protein [Deltaproteobacteria bacterium]
MRFSYESLLNDAVDAAEIFGLQGGLARKNPDLRLLYDTAFEWRELTGTWPMHHVLAAYRDVIEERPELPKRIIDAFQASGEYAKRNFETLMDLFLNQFGGSRKDLEARFTPEEIGRNYSWSLSPAERRTIQLVLDMSLEFGFIRRNCRIDELMFQDH